MQMRIWNIFIAASGALLALAVLLGGSTQSLAQGGDLLAPWPLDVAEPGKQQAEAVEFDSLGNTIITGFAESADQLSRDLFTVKLAADGSGEIWRSPYTLDGKDAAATAIVIDTNDDVIVSGRQWNGSDFDALTIKYDGQTGAELWRHRLDRPGPDDFVLDLGIDSLNNIYLAGHTKVGNSFDDMLLVKYVPTGPDLFGDPLWLRTWDGAAAKHDRVFALAVGGAGLAVTGESQNGSGDYDCVTLKYAFDGSLSWSAERRYIDSGNGKGLDVVLDDTGNVIIAGYTDNGSGPELYLVKYPAGDGPALWVGPVGMAVTGEQASLALDTAGDVHLSTPILNAGNRDFWTAKYSAVAGFEIWQQTSNSGPGNQDYPAELLVESGGDVFVTGRFHDLSAGKDGIFTVKYSGNSGNELWAKSYTGLNLDNRALGLGFNPTGQLLVAGWSDQGTSGASDFNYHLLGYDPGDLNPPTALLAKTLMDSSVQLDWTNNAGASVEDFVIEAKIGILGAYGEVATVPGTQTQYSHTGLPADTRYYYRVKAVNATLGSSNYSNEASAKTTVINYGTPNWNYSFNGIDNSEDYAESVATGPDGHPVVTGSTMNFSSSFDYHTIKLDRIGQSPIWSATYNSEFFEIDMAAAVVVDSFNRPTVSGFSYLYGGGAQNTNDIFTINYPATGPTPSDNDWNWKDQYNGPGGDDDRSETVASAIDDSDSLAVVGYGKNGQGNDDIYLIKHPSDGGRAWTPVAYDGGGDDYPRAVAFGPLGEILVVGQSHNGSDYDYYISKYAGADGSLAWRKIIGGTDDGATDNGDDVASGVAIGADGSVYVTGRVIGADGSSDILTRAYDSDGTEKVFSPLIFTGSGLGYDAAVGIAIDPIDGEILVGGSTSVGPGNQDMLLLRYQTDGTQVWAKTLNLPDTDDAAVAMTIDRSGVVTLAGQTGSGTWDDAMAVKFDHNGTIVGANVYAGAAGQDDWATSVASNPFGEVFVAGSTTNAAGNADYLIFKVDGSVQQAPYPLMLTQYYTQVQLDWADNSFDEAGFEIERKTGACAAALPWVSLSTEVSDITTYTDGGLNIGSTYCYRVRSYSALGDSSRWAEKEVTTAEPLVPDNLVLTPLSTTEIEVSWQLNSTGQDGLVLERCLGGGCDFTPVDASFSLPGDSLLYLDNSVCAGQTYRYRLRVLKTGEWTSAFSLPSTDLLQTTPAVVDNLTSDFVGEAEVDFYWSYSDTDQSSYRVERCDNLPANCTQDADFTTVGTPISLAGNQLLLRMDESDWNGAGMVLDSSGMGRHATATTASPGAAGRFNRAGTFAGASYITTPLSLDQSASTVGATLSAWVRPETLSSGYHYVFSTDNGGYDWGLIRNAGIWYVATGATLRSTGVSVDLRQWQHLVVVFEPTGVRFYKNGTETLVNSIGFDTSAGPLTLGRRGNYNQEFFDGSIDEVAAFDRPLSLVEIQELHQTGVRRFSDTTVVSGTDYSYRVRADKNAGCGWPASAGTLLGVTALPQAPAKVGGTVISTTTLDLNWEDRTTTESGFAVERCLEDGAGGCVSAFAPLATAGAESQRFRDDQTCAGTSYKYRLRAENPGLWGQSEPSSELILTTPAASAVSALTLADSSEEQIDLEWSFTSPDRSGFKIWRCAGAGATCLTDSDFSLIDTIAGRPAGLTMALAMDELAWSGAADEVVDSSGHNNHGTSVGWAALTDAAISGQAGFFDGIDNGVATSLVLDQSASSPGATFDLWAYPTLQDNAVRYLFSTENGGYDWGLTLSSGNWYVDTGKSRQLVASATLNSWQHLLVVFEPGVGVRFYQDNAASEVAIAEIGTQTSSAALNIGRHPAGHSVFAGRIDEVAFYNRALSSSEAGLLVSGKLTYRDRGLSAASPYRYRVAAYKNAGCSWENQPVSLAATTSGVLAPGNLRLVDSDTTRADLAWDDLTSTETRYLLQRCTGDAGICTGDALFVDQFLLPADTQNYSDTSRCEGQAYTYRLRAEKESAATWQSPWSQLTVPGVTAEAPALFTLNVVSESDVEISWQDAGIDEDRFVLERCLGDAAACASGSFVQVDTVLGTLPGNLMLLRMDEAVWSAAAGQVIDSSGADNQGNPVGGINTVSEGYHGRAASFDGNNDYIATGLNLDQSFLSSGATMEAWVKTTSAGDGNYRGLISTENTSAAGWGLLVRNGTWWVDYGSSSKWNTGVAVDTLNWQHLAVVFEPGIGLRFYKNGTETISTILPLFSVNDRSVIIGRRAHYAYNWASFSGLLDEVAIYDHPLTMAQIQEHIRNGLQIFEERDIGLTPDSEYTYRVKAVKDAACGAPPYAEATIRTLKPPSPDSFIGSAGDSTAIDLSWRVLTGAETGLRLQRCQVGIDCPVFGDLPTLGAGMLAAGTESYTDTEVCEGSAYRYQLWAVKDDAPPTWATDPVVSVDITLPTQTAPSALAASQVSEVRVDLSWTAASGDKTGYEIWRCQGASCNDFALVNSTTELETSFIDGELAPGVSYRYQVRAYKDAYCPWASSFTNIAIAETRVIAPEALTATKVDTTTIALQWLDKAGTETDNDIERCQGAGCVDFTPFALVGSNLTSFTDDQACQGESYSYRIHSRSQGLSEGNNGCWTGRQPLSFSAFLPDSDYRIEVAWAPEMRADFADLRFYDSIGQRELAYYIYEKTDGVTATLWFKTGANAEIYLYYGNAMARDAGQKARFVTEMLSDDFVGTSINSSHWNSAGQGANWRVSNTLELFNGWFSNADNWNYGAKSIIAIPRIAGSEIYARFTIPEDTDHIVSNHFMLGWESSVPAATSFSNLGYAIHQLYFNNGALQVFEANSYPDPAGLTYTWDTEYELRIELRDVGARYYLRGGSYSDWTLLAETSVRSDSPLRLSVHQYNHQVQIHELRLDQVQTRTGVSLGGVESDACYAFNNTWISQNSNEATALTDPALAPTLDSVQAISDTQVQLNWISNSSDQTGFKIERCLSAACSFTQVGTAGAEATSYTDNNINPSESYRYRVRATKAAFCAWDSAPSSELEALTYAATPTNLSVSAINARILRLDWDPQYADEDGYEIEIQLWNGTFAGIATVGKGVFTYADAQGLEPETSYTYRVRAIRQVPASAPPVYEASAYSNLATGTTLTIDLGNDTCKP